MQARFFLAVAAAALVGAQPATAAPEPELGRTAVLNTASGTVLIKEPGDQRFRRLPQSPTLIRMGSVIDTTDGRVRVLAAAGEGDVSDGKFWAGRFVISQSKSRRARGFTKLRLSGGEAGACEAQASAAGASSGVGRKLWGKGNGKFTSQGGHGSASTRGTTWLTEDRCDGTRVSVNSGRVQTDTGGELEFRVSAGQVVQYYCDFEGLDPVSSTYCTSVHSAPDIGLWAAGLLNQGDAASYDLCLTDPTAEERCSTYPLSEPQGRSGLRDSFVSCQADRGAGAYSVRWLIAGVQLGPPIGFTVDSPVGAGCLSIP